jgi:hypothetical protein
LFLKFFSTIFSFLKLVCSFWQIARLQEFFINYRIGSHKHLDKQYLPKHIYGIKVRCYGEHVVEHIGNHGKKMKKKSSPPPTPPPPPQNIKLEKRKAP